MSCDADGAIQVLQDGLAMEKKNRFKQADSLVIPLLLNAPRIAIYRFGSWCSSWHGRC